MELGLVEFQGLTIMNLVMTYCALAATVGEIDYITDGVESYDRQSWFIVHLQLYRWW